MPHIQISAPFSHGGHVSPYLVGNFVELLADHVPALRAELLGDGQFEGPLPPAEWCCYRAEEDWREPGWELSGGATLAREPQPEVGACLELASPGARAMQSGLDCRLGEPLALRLYARALAGSGRLIATVEDAEGPLSSCELSIDRGEWHRLAGELQPARAGRAVRFILMLRDGGPVRVDRVSLGPTDAAEGWRRDAVAATRALRPGLLRWGGSVIEEYDWEAGIGDLEARLPFENRPWGHRDPNSVGVEEFLQFCRLTECEPLVCVRFTAVTPADAARQVEYLNGDPESAEGQRRAANGRPAPWGVRLWQVGNEVSGPEYEDRLPDFCRAMWAADPSIQLLASYPSAGVLERAGELLAYVCPHHYHCADLPRVEAELQELIRQIERTAPHVRIGVTEWNTTAGDWGEGRGELWTLGNALAGARYLNLLHRYSHRVTLACRSALANSYCSGALQIRGTQLVRTPAYEMLRLYAAADGGAALQCRATDGLDVSAVRLPDRLLVYLVNGSPQSGTAALQCETLPLPAAGQIWTLRDTVPEPGERAINGFSTPDRVRVTGPEPCRPNEFTFPALSVSRIEFPVTTLG
jgi:alpha-N-arabinofuranosidase